VRRKFQFESYTSSVAPSPDDLLACYREVSAQHPLLTSSGIERLAALHHERWNSAVRFWSLEKEFPDLKADIALPDAAARPSSVFNEFMIVAARLFFFANSQRQCRARILDWGVSENYPVLMQSGFNCCLAAQQQHLEIVPLSAFLGRPLPECGLPVCQCRCLMMENPDDYGRFRT
jgi:hypothetical protein